MCSELNTRARKLTSAWARSETEEWDYVVGRAMMARGHPELQETRHRIETHFTSLRSSLAV